MNKAILNQTAAKTLATSLRLRGASAAGKKTIALHSLADAKLRSDSAAAVCLSALLFLRAYPDNAQIAKQAEAELERLSERTGAGKVVLSVSWRLACWIAEHFSSSARIDWDNPPAEEPLTELFESAFLTPERDILISQQYEQKQLVELLSGPKCTDLQGLIAAVRTLGKSEEASQRIYAMLGVWIQIDLPNYHSSLPGIRLLPGKLHFHSGKLKRSTSVRAQLRRKLPQPLKLKLQDN